MGIFGSRENDPVAVELLDRIKGLSKDVAALKGEHEAAREALGLTSEIVDLKRQLSDLEIQKDREKEQRERQKREVEHKVGLERMRFEQEKKDHEKEVEISKREARLSVREDKLKEEREKFEQQMDFITKRFEKEVTYTQDLMKEILKRVPEVTVEAMMGRGNAQE